MKALRSALGVIREARRPYLALNVAYYGLIAGAMAYAAFDSSLQPALMASVGSALTEGPLEPVLEAYTEGQIWQAIGLTFGINLLVASFATITLPSLVVPFSGLLLAGLRAVLWGVLFTPRVGGGVGTADVVTGLLLLLLLILEGQGYVLTAFGVYLHGRAFLRPRSVGATGHWQGYRQGLKQQARVYLLVAIVLLVSAVYEVLLAVVAAPALL